MAADAVLLVHFAFILFVVAGALLVIRWPPIAFLHLPAVAWAVFVEATDRVCPLTPLENALRAQSGLAGYRGDFVAHYLLGIIYPAGLTRDARYALAILVIVANAAAYAWLVLRARRASRRG